MPARIALLPLSMGLLLLAGCAQQLEVHQITSAQVTVQPDSDDASGRALSGDQLTALTAWIKTHTHCSGMSADIPQHPALQFQLQDSSGMSDRLSVYEHTDGAATFYLYQGERLAPLRCHVSAADLARLKSAIGQAP
ncbi:MAG TPA: hypothetical protein VME63_07995 [Dyella sp.]|uniref:hypothetical protein n=1 Tax=Dyella sp. TaxID=1869338 RepID=UPI002C756E89|nr:hypothetical protein [Dyella sp.]HTV85332.1 hypothetical protein [Dyella sp.]